MTAPPDPEASPAGALAGNVSGPAFGWQVIAAALGGPYPVGELADLPLALAYGGANGMRHFHPGCPPMRTRREPVTRPRHTHTTLGRLFADVPGSRQHFCAEDFPAWLPARERAELTLLAQAADLTAGWRQAQDRTARTGREHLPADAGPLTGGTLEDLIVRVEAHLAGHPHRAHVRDLGAALRQVWHDWAERAARAGPLAAADPHAAVLAWQRGLGLPPMAGTPTQVRWAEQIRFQAHAAAPAQVRPLLHRPTTAGSWIGLYRAAANRRGPTQTLPAPPLARRDWRAALTARGLLTASPRHS